MIESSNLTRREFDLLYTLALEPGSRPARPTIADRVWGAEYQGEPQVVYVHIRWLREKLEEEPNRPRRIITLRGLGYKLESLGGLMFSTLRRRFVFSHLVPLLVIVPLIGIALIYLLEAEVVLPSLSNELASQAGLVVEMTRDQPGVWTHSAQAQALVAGGSPAADCPADAAGRKWTAAGFQRAQ